ACVRIGENSCCAACCNTILYESHGKWLLPAAEFAIVETAQNALANEKTGGAVSRAIHPPPIWTCSDRRFFNSLIAVVYARITGWFLNIREYAKMSRCQNACSKCVRLKQQMLRITRGPRLSSSQ